MRAYYGVMAALVQAIAVQLSLSLSLFCVILDPICSHGCGHPLFFVVCYPAAHTSQQQPQPAASRTIIIFPAIVACVFEGGKGGEAQE